MIYLALVVVVVVWSKPLKLFSFQYDCEFEDFVLIAATMANICEDMTDAYLVSVEFYKMFKKSKDSNEILVSFFFSISKDWKILFMINYSYPFTNLYMLLLYGGSWWAADL